MSNNRHGVMKVPTRTSARPSRSRGSCRRRHGRRGVRAHPGDGGRRAARPARRRARHRAGARVGAVAAESRDRGASLNRAEIADRVPLPPMTQSATASTDTERYRPVDLRTVADMPQWALLERAEVGHRGGRRGAAVPYEPLRDGPPDQLVQRAARPDLSSSFRNGRCSAPRIRGRGAVAAQGRPGALAADVSRIRMSLNPHPAGQLTHNVPARRPPAAGGAAAQVRETLLFFPGAGQTCHAYCTYCFRWAQFVGLQDIKFQTTETGRPLDYLRTHRDITDVLITGGDPMIMRTKMCAVTSSRCSRPSSITSRTSPSARRPWRTGRSGSFPTRTPTTACACSTR